MAEVFNENLPSTSDALQIATLHMAPAGEVRCVVQLAHGMSEHKERYIEFMEYLAARGCACAINDHRGHGQSVREQADLGYFYAGGADALVEDMHMLTRRLRSLYPGRKLSLFGHSMGSLAVRAYADNYDGDIDALIVCGSPGRNAGVNAGLVLARLIERLRGGRYVSPLLQKLTVGAFAARFPGSEFAHSWISARRENVVAYEQDPLCGFDFTINGDRALLTLMKRAYALSSRRHNAGLPVRFYSGADDPCAPDARGFQEAMECMKKAGFTNVSGRMFAGMRHEILNEDGREAVYEAIFTESIAPLFT